MRGLLKRLVPAPLRAPIRGAVLFVIPPLRRRLTRTWRRRNRLNRRVRRVRNRVKRLRRKLQKALKNIWRRKLKQRRRRGTLPIEPSNQKLSKQKYEREIEELKSR